MNKFLIASQLAIGNLVIFGLGSNWGILNIAVAAFVAMVELIMAVVTQPDEDEQDSDDGPITIGNQPTHDIARALKMQAATFSQN